MTSNSGTSKNRAAIRLSGGGEVEKTLRRFAERLPIDHLQTFLPKDDDELNNALLAGEFDHAIFHDLDSLLETVWKGEGRLEEWQAAGVRIHLVSPPLPEDATWKKVVLDCTQSLERWRAKRRNHQIVASVILSLLALGAVAALLMFVPPSR